MDFAEKNTETVTISRAEYEAQQAKIAKLENQVTLLMEALRLSKHKQFGASSEKSGEDVMEQLSYLFNEAEAFAPAEGESDTVTVPEHQRSKKSKKNEYTLDSIPDDMPREVIDHTLDGEDLVCPQCGDTMTEIGVEVTRKLKIRQAEFVVEEHRYHTVTLTVKKEVKTDLLKNDDPLKSFLTDPANRIYRFQFVTVEPDPDHVSPEYQAKVYPYKLYNNNHDIEEEGTIQSGQWVYLANEYTLEIYNFERQRFYLREEVMNEDGSWGDKGRDFRAHFDLHVKKDGNESTNKCFYEYQKKYERDSKGTPKGKEYGRQPYFDLKDQHFTDILNYNEFEIIAQNYFYPYAELTVKKVVDFPNQNDPRIALDEYYEFNFKEFAAQTYETKVYYQVFKNGVDDTSNYLNDMETGNYPIAGSDVCSNGQTLPFIIWNSTESKINTTFYLKAGQEAKFLYVPLKYNVGASSTFTVQEIVPLDAEYTSEWKDGISSVTFSHPDITTEDYPSATIACKNTYLYGSLEIKKTGMSEGEYAIFNVNKVGDNDSKTFVTQVVVPNDSIVKVDWLPFGTYEVQEVGEWTWRYRAKPYVNQVTFDATNLEKGVNVYNDKFNNQWLSDESIAVNDFAAK